MPSCLFPICIRERPFLPAQRPSSPPAFLVCKWTLPVQWTLLLTMKGSCEPSIPCRLMYLLCPCVVSGAEVQTPLVGVLWWSASFLLSQ